jgi:hypothetical protein
VKCKPSIHGSYPREKACHVGKETGRNRFTPYFPCFELESGIYQLTALSYAIEETVHEKAGLWPMSQSSSNVRNNMSVARFHRIWPEIG